ncbi:hypothetical protein BR10RB9215_C10736 [Brucella sp. 10RB9215]|uniref:hypothetical protein n=1 Tax=Brucella sp. 10RB9215 TaxID=1149953 RepID=UPI00090BFE05|nr:hypothetical protein [Brucella sp. 10RB9215]SBW13920.1 hypothetical protein BR10RB9215_C10736 [Brucella sp. 10RB9215]
MAETEKSVYIGTISYLISNRSYHDFIVGGMNVNQLPLLSDSVARLQNSLDLLPAVQMAYDRKTRNYSGRTSKNFRHYENIEPFLFEIQNFFIESVSFESGSVYAKVKIGAFIAFTAYNGLADYNDVKAGFTELRSDIIQIVSDAFGVDGAGPIQGQQPVDDADIRYYFIQPSRLEDEVLKRRAAEQ